MNISQSTEVVKVSFDSNAWEQLFADDGYAFTSTMAALRDGTMEGFICAASFRIEAIRKRNRPAYFSQPHMDTRYDGFVRRDGERYRQFSIGPDDQRHEGLPDVQATKLERALVAGVRLMQGQNWMGLPIPRRCRDPSLYVAEDRTTRSRREQRQLDASAAIDRRGVGHAAFEAAGGWEQRSLTPAEERMLIRACAEWADGELVAAHIAYGNDILCTDDRARAAGRSIFDSEHRAWLMADFGVIFMSVEELSAAA